MVLKVNCYNYIFFVCETLLCVTIWDSCFANSSHQIVFVIMYEIKMSSLNIYVLFKSLLMFNASI